jgi:hypothetical protein
LTPGESARPPITGISPYKPVNFVHKYVNHQNGGGF